jgi:aspartate racemase
MKNRDIVGIVGGMGSHAAASLFQAMVNKCPARDDREFLEIIVHNNSRIPDRTDAILNFGESPFSELMRSVRMLHAQRANYIIMACVTAHYYFDQLKRSLPEANIVNLLDVVVHYIKMNCSTVRSVGIIASTGVVRSGLWKSKLETAGIELIYLDAAEQEFYFTDAIYGDEGIKRGYIKEPRKKLLQAGEKLVTRGAQAILASCSELPLVLSQQDFDIPFIDAFDVLTDYVIGRCYQEHGVLVKA